MTALPSIAEEPTRAERVVRRRRCLTVLIIEDRPNTMMLPIAKIDSTAPKSR